MIPRTILCFGDSNTWGHIPGSGERYGYDVRWPGALQRLLGTRARVIEEGLNGRTTVWDEPVRPGRSGKELLVPLLESHAPIDLVIIMLGTNDLDRCYHATAHDVARGAGSLVAMVQQSAFGPNDNPPSVLLVAPPRVGKLVEDLYIEFEGAFVKAAEFSHHFRAKAQELGCHFLDAAGIAVPSEIDGVHLDQDGHKALAQALARFLESVG